MRLSDSVSLAGEHGELLAVRLAVDPRLVEDALDALAGAPFPINPELRHPAPGERTLIEFPAYEEQLNALSGVLRSYGLDATLSSRPMVQQLRCE